MAGFIWFLLIGGWLVLGALGVRYGDEQYSNAPDGWLYVFSPGIVRVVDPWDGSIIHSLDTPNANWGDMVYMEEEEEGQTKRRYVFATDGNNGDVWVLDTEEVQVVAHTHLGSSPEQVYALEATQSIWVHLDKEAAFSVLDMQNVSQVARNGILARTSTTMAHGKLAFDPSYAERAFASNTGEGKIFELSIKDQRLERSSQVALVGKPVCTGTDGISYHSNTNRVYVECGNPGDCELPAHPERCTGAVWEVSASTLTPLARLVSPSLSAKYGGEFGVQGHPWDSPDGNYVFVGNKRAGMLAILRPQDDGTDVIEAPCKFSPGRVVFWRKDGGTPWGASTDARDYVAVISLESSDPESGVAFIDMDDVVDAFEGGEKNLSSDAVKYLKVGAGGQYRPIVRGGDFIATPTFFDGNKYSDLAIIDARTREVVRTVAIDDITRVLWVPKAS